MLAQFFAITFYVLALFSGQTDVSHSFTAFSDSQATFQISIISKKSDLALKSIVEQPLLQDSLGVKRVGGGKSWRISLGYLKGQTTFPKGQHWGISLVSVKARGKLSFQLSPLQLIEVFLI
jgi:hypothetical protein